MFTTHPKCVVNTCVKRRCYAMALNVPVYATNGVYMGLAEIRRTPFCPFALVAFRDVFYLAAFKKGFHLYLTAAGAHKFLGRAGGTAVLTGLGHSFLLKKSIGNRVL